MVVETKFGATGETLRLTIDEISHRNTYETTVYTVYFRRVPHACLCVLQSPR